MVDIPQGMKLASGENVDYYMFVPESWNVDRSDLYTNAVFSSGDPSSLDHTSISTTVYAVSNDIQCVDDWWNKEDGFLAELSLVYTDISEISEAEATLGGVDGIEYSFTAKLGGVEYCFVITAVWSDFYIYFVTYTSMPQYTDEHADDRAQVIESFTFKD